MTDTAHIDVIIDRAIARLGDRGHDIRVQQVLRDAVADAFRQGKHVAFSDLMGAPEVAEALGVTRAYVNRVASRIGAGARIGGTTMVYTPDDLAAIRAEIATDRRRSDG